MKSMQQPEQRNRSAMSNSERITFRNIEISSSGVVECNVVHHDVDAHFWIELPYSYKPSPDLVAFSYAAICGKKFDEIYIDLPLGARARESIEHACEAKLCSQEGEDRRRHTGVQHALNFSGGFDSLAARCLLPDAELISLDFGGKFAREQKFFKRFEPYVFRTNLVDIQLNRLSWQFMGIGSILLRDELQLSSYSFGSIMASSLPLLLGRKQVQSRGGIAVAESVGLSVRNPVAGLTEIGSMSIAIAAFHDLLPQVLASVALPKEDKYLRKVQMLRAVCGSTGQWAPPIDVPQTSPRRSWGDSFATDLSSVFAMKEIGTLAISSTYKDGIPTEVLDAVPTLDLDFMFRFNPHAYGGIPKTQLGKWYRTFVENDLVPFEAKDWDAAKRVVDLLNDRNRPA